MKEKLSKVFTELLARNRGVDGRRDYYGVRIEDASPDGSEFDLILIFKSVESYCCAESGCHVGYHRRDWWEALRRIMGEHALGDLPPLKIRRTRGIIEDGARLRCHVSFGMPEEPARYSYENGPHAEIIGQ